MVEQVAPHRDIAITWQPISLLFKNQPPSDSEYYAMSVSSHRMLRVMESVRSTHGEQKAFEWYWACGTLIHQGNDDLDDAGDADLGDLLARIGVDRSRASDADDVVWDAEIRTRMGAGLALVGNDVGIPIISFEGDDGTSKGIFGPVISRIPTGQQSLALWDATVALTKIDGFWELKRTRTERPIFPAAP